MQERDAAYLADILVAARLVQRFVAGVTREDFERDVMRESAVARQLEIVCEATKNVSEELRRAHPEIPWRKMAGMRDLLIHAYRRVDPAEVWQAATVAVPALISALEPLVRSVQDSEEDSRS